ncbi:hypothetical protein ACXR6G_02285 [Ancylomarina sp. YFZ004]
MKQIGIWIDKREAKIVSIEAGDEHLNIITSDIEDFHAAGGSGTRLKGGPQDVVKDSTYLERERHQLAEFFKDIIKSIVDADEIVIFGPAQTRLKLIDELSEKYSQLHSKIKSTEKADNMTDNQIKAWVRAYYASDK